MPDRLGPYRCAPPGRLDPKEWEPERLPCDVRHRATGIRFCIEVKAGHWGVGPDRENLLVAYVARDSAPLAATLDAARLAALGGEAVRACFLFCDFLQEDAPDSAKH